MRRNGEVAVERLGDIPPLVATVLTNPYVLAGVLSMAVYFAAYITALAWVDVSVANPLTALSYVIATAYAFAPAYAGVGCLRAVRIVLVTSGVILAGLSS
ncbi:MAG: hypothetical protein A2Z18_08955 [Armatimonadetes bacterium RBG_16_58_9]|nr:MAG: hypothetical protein A2Z18_08955 [Armatimonadetes bacterium RBG_16_58_9]